MQERRRKFYGWGYEGDTVSPAETAEFESAWSQLLGIDHFEAVPFPKEEDIDLRAPRIQPPASLATICTTDKYDRLYHTYGAGNIESRRFPVSGPKNNGNVRHPHRKVSSSAGYSLLAIPATLAAAGVPKGDSK